jgi:polysaccharide export outer membrane protein
MMLRMSKLVCLAITVAMFSGAWAQNSGGKKANDKVAALKPAETAGTLPAEKDKTSASDSSSTAAKTNDPSQYRIGEQDVLVITVWREPELSATVMVRPDGKVTLPLVNDVTAAGLSTDELKSLLTEKLRPFVNVPQVTVAVREINSRKVFVIGQVAHEGSYRVNSTTTVLQVIAEAGGLRDFANRKGIYVLRQQNGGQVKLSFNYDKVIRGKDNNIQLRPGDTVVVP